MASRAVHAEQLGGCSADLDRLAGLRAAGLGCAAAARVVVLVWAARALNMPVPRDARRTAPDYQDHDIAEEHATTGQFRSQHPWNRPAIRARRKRPVDQPR